MSQLSRRRLLESIAGAAALLVPRRGKADAYPSRPIRLVIPYAAGGAGDQVGRPWADKMVSLLGPTYVENIAGAGGALGCAAVAQSAPDGYSLLLGNGSTQVMIPLTSTRLAYDPIRDFRAVCCLITSTLAFVVHPSVPARDLLSLKTYALANPGKISYGTPGSGTGNHLVGELFEQQSGAAKIVHIPYRGMGLATNDLVGGQIPLIIAVVSSYLLQLHQAGKLRILAVTSETRLAGTPEIPTVIECGMPELKYAGWFGLFAPKATPDAIVNRIVGATSTAMSAPALQQAYRSQGLEPDTASTPAKFAQLIEDELNRFRPVVKSMGLQRD